MAQGLPVARMFATMKRHVHRADTPTDAPTDAAGDVTEALAALLLADVSSAERDDLTRLVGHVRQVRGALDAVDVQIARRGRQLAERDRPCPTPAPDAPPPRPDRGRAT